MSLETIKKKIKEAGEKEAGEILNAGEKEISLSRAETAETVKTMAEEAEKALTQKRAQILEEARIRADFSRRDFLLAKKRELIDQIFKAVLKNLANLPAEKKQKFLGQCLDKTKKEIGDQGRIYACSADWELVKKLLKQHSKLELSKKTTPGVGGFLAVNNQMELNYTFENLVAEKREALESEVAGILF